jgi:acetyl-CoA synthetase
MLIYKKGHVVRYYSWLLLYIIMLNGYSMSSFLSEQDLHLWDCQAKQLPWFKQWTHVLEMQGTYAHWFVDGFLNASFACLDIHIQQGLSDHVAIYWSNEQGESRTITYGQLYKDVNAYAAYLRSCGVDCGDKVIVYMPMIPEALVAMLACARIGAIHVVVFSGFSAQALRDRIDDVKATYVLTCDVSFYRGKILNLKHIVDQALEYNEGVRHVIIIQRVNEPIVCIKGRDLIYKALDSQDVYIEPIPVESNHPLFILYTSGTTGKPKGIVHSTGGYLTYVYSTIKWAFDIKKESIYWCTADIGWITGHSYGVYGPLMHGATIVMREGAPDWPDATAWWKIIDQYKVSIFYTSPTALRMFMRLGPELLQNADLRSLSILGSVGEPINPEVWQWFYHAIGKQCCPIIDTWWQTETGGFMIAPTAGNTLVPLKPGSATYPMPGIEASIVDKDGREVLAGTKGYLIIKKPWPGMMIGIQNNPALYNDIYWSKFPGCYYAGDYAMCDSDGYFWLLGRADEVIKVSGHRIGTAELESAIMQHEAVAENVAIGLSDPIKGEAIAIFLVLKQGYDMQPALYDQIVQLVRATIGSFATPRDIYCVATLPKTRSGKIMRRLLKALLEGQPIGDVSTLEDGVSVQEVQQALASIHQRTKFNRV